MKKKNIAKNQKSCSPFFCFGKNNQNTKNEFRKKICITNQLLKFFIWINTSSWCYNEKQPSKNLMIRKLIFFEQKMLIQMIHYGKIHTLEDNISSQIVSDTMYYVSNLIPSTFPTCPPKLSPPRKNWKSASPSLKKTSLQWRYK